VERRTEARRHDEQRDGQHGGDRVSHSAIVNLVIWSFRHLVIHSFIDQK